MSTIRIMDELLSNKIAAGEVVEKCVSIVKELVENSIDAKSSVIKIELEESGVESITVTDDGVGMNNEDALLCFSRHATSKLLDEDELFNIHTLGFRGEALPSIASVSEVVLKTCNDNDSSLIHIKGGKIVKNSKSEFRKGTSITVTNLFYNTPARLKHLGSLYSELSNITEYIERIALSYPNIKFELINDGKTLLNTDGSGNQLKVINAIYGIDITKKMIEVNGHNDDYTVSGYISLPEVTRSNRNHMITIVNGRVIKNYLLNKIINDAYHTYKEDTRYPIVVLNINTDPSLIDVNIHPSKMDIKFGNFDELMNLITNLIKDTISTKLLIPKVEIKEVKEYPKYDNFKIDFASLVREEEATYQEDNFLAFNNENTTQREDKTPYIEERMTNNLPDLYPVGLLMGTYIACHNDGGIYLVDQHAAKERINYEKYSYELAHPKKETIGLLVPIIIELPMNEYIIVRENINILTDMYIDIEEFGTSSFRITSVPTWFPNMDADYVIKKMIELIISLEKRFDLKTFNDRLSMDVACKKSIKANTFISMEEMEVLIKELSTCNDPYHCPHGRPTIINFTKYELEKLFKRSM